MELCHEPFNGCTNYETWCVIWWLTNDEGISCRCRRLAAEALDVVVDASRRLDGNETTAEATRNLLADVLRELVDDFNPVANQTALFTDLMESALNEVNWHEIADEFLKE